MNTLNEYELSRIRKLYQDQLRSEQAGETQLRRSKSSRLSSGPRRGSQRQVNGVSSEMKLDFWRRIFRDAKQSANQYGHILEPAGVDLNRYQHALRLGMRSGSRLVQRSSSGLVRFGRALFDFQAKNEQEISLRRGDLVEIIKAIDHNWALVEDCQSGLQGIAPLGYLDYSVGCAVAKRDVSGDQRLGSSRTQANANLVGRQLLPMNKGEPITLLRRLRGHWYEASNTRQAMGLVWSNDLEIIKKPVLVSAQNPLDGTPEPHSGASSHFEDPASANEADFSNNQTDSEFCDPEDELWTSRGQRRRARSASGSQSRNFKSEIYDDDVTCECRVSGFETDQKPRRSTSSPYILSQQPQLPPKPQFLVQTCTTGELPRLCRAKYAYKPRQKDELELVVGDILLVVHECDDGWFIGSSYTTKEMGTFPGNFVEFV